MVVSSFNSKLGHYSIFIKITFCERQVIWQACALPQQKRSMQKHTDRLSSTCKRLSIGAKSQALLEKPKKQLLRDTSVTLLCDFKVTWHKFFLQKEPKHLVTFWASLIPTAYYVKTAAISFWTTFEFLGYFLFNIWSHWMPTMFIDTYPLQMLKQTILVLYNKHILPTFGNKNTSSSSKQPFEKHTHAQIDTHCLFHSHTPTDSVTRSGAMLSIGQFSGVISIS